MKRSLRRKNDANTMDRQAKHVDAIITITMVPSMLMSPKTNVTPSKKEIKMIIAVCIRPLAPAEIPFPRTIDCRDVGVAIIFARIPESLSQVIAIPKKIEVKRIDCAIIPGAIKEMYERLPVLIIR